MTDTNLIEDLRLLSPPEYGWPVALVAAGLFAAIVVLAWRVLRRPVPVSSPMGPGAEPGEDALAALEGLTALLHPEHSREYGIRATAILRCYIERRYGIRAPHLATEEFLLAARNHTALAGEHRSSLGRFLALCDLFKFGRYIALAEELQALHAAAVGFVLAARPAPAAETATEVKR